MSTDPHAPVFDCKARRHKVIGITPAGTPDGICVICGARGVVDARAKQPSDVARLAPPTARQELL